MAVGTALGLALRNQGWRGKQSLRAGAGKYSPSGVESTPRQTPTLASLLPPVWFRGYQKQGRRDDVATTSAVHRGRGRPSPLKSLTTLAESDLLLQFSR